MAFFADAWGALGDAHASWVVSHGVALDFAERPQLSRVPLSFPGRNQGILEEQVSQLLQKEAIEPVRDLSSPGFYNRLFVVPKESGGWRPVIDLSAMNRHLVVPHFKMETSQSIRHALHRGEWVASIDLKDA